MKKIKPDSPNSLNEKPGMNPGNNDEKFGGRHGGREDIHSKASEENLTFPTRNDFNKRDPKSKT
ncbi:MAG: hypothetical protein ACXWQO_16725 [Bdellovibrionota bacterium]